ncbi:MAG: hypothetical protein F2956_04000 [Actinobacteria bacterium]|nr:hypothetical protein [Actinomycetota bacterium]
MRMSIAQHCEWITSIIDMNVPNFFSRFTQRQRIKRRLTQATSFGNENIIDSLSAMTRSLRSGQSLASSLHQASITEPCDLLIRLAAAINNGQSLNQACNYLIEADEKQNPAGDLSVVLHVISLASEVGGDAAHHIDALIDTLLDRSYARQDRQAQASTAMASTRLITWLPVVCAAWIVSDSPAIRNTMLATPLGWTCLALGIGLNLVGRMWTNKLINS